MLTQKCKICDAYVTEEPSNRDTTGINCPACGRYIISGSLLHTKIYFGDHADKSNFYKVSSWIREQNDVLGIEIAELTTDNFEDILNAKDKKIKEKFDLMMHYLLNFKIKFKLDKKTLIKCWTRDENEFLKLYQKALDGTLVKGKITKVGTINHLEFDELTFDGIEYVENLDSPNQSSKNIFVAFNFKDGLKEVFNVHVNKAITENGFNYVVVNQDNVEHNKSINDEIIVKLKSARIVIADFTHHRNSVYFEAGFAMGMNIPIIWTCREEHEDDMSFDTRQFPHIIWKDKDDLVKQVIDRIKVIL